MVNRKVQFVVALVLAIGIAVLLVLPAFDVLPTAMRAWRAAKLLALAMATQVLIFILAAITRFLAEASSDAGDFSLARLDLTCTRRC